MMIIPSMIVPEKDQELQIDDTRPGIYSIINAYDGIFAYFSDHLTVDEFSASQIDRGIYDYLEPLKNFPMSTNGKTHALVIGVNDYADHKLPKLDFAKRDAEEISKVLHSKYETSVFLLTGKKATRENILLSLHQLKNTSVSEDTVLIYFSGHARPSGTDNKHRWLVDYLSAYDTNTDSPTNTGILVEELREWIVNIAASKVLIILDACYSVGILPQDMYKKDNLTESFSRLLGDRGGRALIVPTASSQLFHIGQASFDRYHSLFASSFIDALKGGALDDKNMIRVRNLYSYLRKKIETVELLETNDNNFTILVGESVR